MKTEKQRIAETVLLLRILGKDNNIFGNLKLQKEVFLTELRLLEANLGGLYYKYFFYNYGPFSSDLATDYTSLAEKGFIHKTTYRLTPRGQYLVEFVEGSIRRHGQNSKILDIVDTTVTKYRKFNGRQLMQIVYDLVVEPEDMPGKKIKIEDMPIFTDILLPECCNFKSQLEIPAHLLADIKAELSLDKKIWESLEEVHADAIKEATQSLMRAVSSDPP
jgi:uncharacterized protein YwgA